MKITAIEIRQHTFEKGMRGYKTEDVDAFLVSLSQEWERVTSDYKMLKMQLEMSEKELSKLKEVEMTLFRTLKMAEDTSTQITGQATKAGEDYVAEARQKADDLLAEARKRSALMVQDAENQARFLKDNILNDINALEHDFKALEHYKENLAVQIRALASSATDSVDRFEKKFAKQNLRGKIDEVTNQIADERKERESQNQPAPPPPDDVADAAVASLSPLVEREGYRPEAIPVDEPMAAKPDEATEQPTQPQLQPAPVDQITETNGAESPPGEPKQAVDETPTTPVEAPQERRERKSSSFFDQI